MLCGSNDFLPQVVRIFLTGNSAPYFRHAAEYLLNSWRLFFLQDGGNNIYIVSNAQYEHPVTCLRYAELFSFYHKDFGSMTSLISPDWEKE